ncbi:MAG: DeoR/GlpR family DNA-binding transcription regulator [Spirochaetota bacterium]
MSDRLWSAQWLQEIAGLPGEFAERGVRHTRLEHILKILHARREVTVEDLTSRLGVSEVTVRKDLSYLQELGHLRRMHGGAVLAEDNSVAPSLPYRRLAEVRGKEAIASRAARLIKPDDSVFVDAGSTCAQLIPHLKNMPVRVVTNSLEVMIGLADAQDVVLHTVGGSLRRQAGSFIGPTAVASINSVRLDIAFIGTSGVSGDGVFSSQNAIEADFKRAVIAAAGRRVILADESKLGHEAFAVFARSHEIDLLVTTESARAREFCGEFACETEFTEPDRSGDAEQ